MEDTHHLTPLVCAVYGPKYLVYPCPHLSQGFIREGMRFIRHVESILADVDEFAWDSTHEGFSIVSSGSMSVGKWLLRTFSARPNPIVYQGGAPDI